MNNVTRDRSALAGKALKNALPEYTEDEFLAILKDICTAQGTEAYQNDLLENFIEVTGHPEGSDLIYYPENGADDSPEGILKTVKAWRQANGLTGFKTS